MQSVLGWRRCVAVLAVVAAMATAAPARAAVAEFFWSGFNVADAALDKARYERLLYDRFDALFRPAGGAVAKLLGRVKWDEHAWYESAAKRSHVHENLRDLYGVFVSIDKVMEFDPDETVVAGVKRSKFYTYVFATVNVFAAESRNLIFSHPLFLADEFDRRVSLDEILAGTMPKLAAALADPADPFARRVVQRLQEYFGPPGASWEAVRRTAGALHRLDGKLSDTYGVMPLCAKCVQVHDESKLTVVRPERMREFARYYVNARLAAHKQVSFVPEQAGLVESRTGDAAATAKEGDIQRDFGEMCMPDYTDSGGSIVCVRVLGPKHRVKLGVREMIELIGAGDDRALEFTMIVDLSVDKGGERHEAELPVVYKRPVSQNRKVSDVYHINAMVRALAQMDAKTVP